MKRGLIVKISVGIYILGLIGMYFFVDFYLDKKEDRLYNKAVENLETFFPTSEKYFRVVYSGFKVDYEETPLPSRNTKYKFSDEYYESQEALYGNLLKLYSILPSRDSTYVQGDFYHTTGWCLRLMEKLESPAIRTHLLYPYEVGIIRQETPIFYENVTSVQTVVDKAFKFFTENKEFLKSNYLSPSNLSLHDIASVVNNQYFILFNYDQSARDYGRDNIDIQYFNVDWSKIRHEARFHLLIDNFNFLNPSVNYGVSKVITKMKTESCWDIVYNFQKNPKLLDRSNYLSYGFLILTVLLSIITIYQLVKTNKETKLKNESLRDKLMRLCNPQNFTQPYDKKKVDQANILYDQLINVEENDLDELKRIRKIACIELGINFISKEKLDELMKKCEIKNFMNPYDAGKIKIANEMTEKLSSQAIDIDEFEEIEKQIESLNRF